MIDLDREISWSTLFRAAWVILALAGIGGLVSLFPFALQLLLMIIGTVVCGFVASFAWCTLKDKQDARERRARIAAAEDKRLEGVHGVYIPEERTDYAWGLQERRDKWAAKMEVERMAYDIERGVQP